MLFIVKNMLVDTTYSVITYSFVRGPCCAHALTACRNPYLLLYKTQNFVRNFVSAH